MFTHAGMPVAGAYGAMGDNPASDAWRVYLSTPDAPVTVAAAGARGGTVVMDVVPIADLGRQVILSDPSGASVGAWGTGRVSRLRRSRRAGGAFVVRAHTRRYDEVLDFYRGVFGWTTRVDPTPTSSGSPRWWIRPTEPSCCGVMDAGWLPEDVPGAWTVYWETADVDTTASSPPPWRV